MHALVRWARERSSQRPVLGVLGAFFALWLIASLLLAATAFEQTRQDLLFPFFTATSALTVTGLRVTPTSDLPFAAQLVLLVLIKLGGLGMMTLFMLSWALLRKSVSAEGDATLRTAFDRETLRGVLKIVRILLISSVVFELAATVVLFFSFRTQYEPAHALWLALFQSVSAFNNAGFSVIPEGLEFYRSNPVVMGSVLSLIILGGLGAVTYPAILSWLYTRIPSKGGASYLFPIEARIILIGTGILLFGGTALIFMFEQLAGNEDANLFTAFFFSVSSRTAGFSIADVSVFAPASLLLLMFLMFVGAAPGSTGGGVKVTTFMLQLFLLKNFLSGREEIVAWQRRVPMVVVARGALIIVLSLGVVLVGTLALLTLEQITLQKAAFEAFSAFGTVGLSAGATESFGIGGKLVLMVLMTLGRFGPLTLLILLMLPRKKSTIKYLDTHVSLG